MGTPAAQPITRLTTRFDHYLTTVFDQVDNPDQRLTEDIRSFTTTSLSLALLLLGLPITRLTTFDHLLTIIRP